jgi:adenosylcobyric acid synthase
MGASKVVRPVRATCVATNHEIAGYEIHVGSSTGPDCSRPLFKIAGEDDGAQSPDGRIAGTYLHGLMQDNSYRQSFLSAIRPVGPGVDYPVSVETALDELAEGLEAALDIDAVFAIAH